MEQPLATATAAAQAQLQHQEAVNVLDRASDLALWALALQQAIETKLATANGGALAEAMAALHKSYTDRQEPTRIRSYTNAEDRRELASMLRRAG